ncbi:MAG: DUF3592 domain-containing protein [Chloroflexaceae bacterium]
MKQLRRLPGWGLLAPLVGLLVMFGAIVALSMLFSAVVPWEHVPWGGYEAVGQIVAHEPYWSERNYAYPVVTFTTADNEYRFVSARPFGEATHPIGAAVTVIYPPGRPEQVRIGSHGELAFTAAAILVVALTGVAGVARALRRS